LWFTEFNNNVIGRITTSGAITEFSTGLNPGSGPEGIVVGPDGNLWFAEYAGNNIGKITTSGTITEFPVPTAHGGPVDLAVGSPMETCGSPSSMKTTS
jgi:virginiamycin B lyase